jgi:hypothetical protein
MLHPSMCARQDKPGFNTEVLWADLGQPQAVLCASALLCCAVSLTRLWCAGALLPEAQPSLGVPPFCRRRMTAAMV